MHTFQFVLICSTIRLLLTTMYILEQKLKRQVYTAMSKTKEDEIKRRKLPNLPDFKCNTSDNTSFREINSIDFDLQNNKLFNSERRRRTSQITQEIVNIIKQTEVEEETQPIKMASLRRKDDYGTQFERNNKEHVSNMEGSSRRIAGIIDLFQDDEGNWIRKIEITKVPGQGLGFFIKKGNGFDRKNGVFISRVSLGSILDINGLLHTGDEVIEVNRINLKGFPLEDVALMMQIPDKLLLTTKSQIPVKNRGKTYNTIQDKLSVKEISSKDYDDNGNHVDRDILFKSWPQKAKSSTKDKQKTPRVIVDGRESRTKLQPTLEQTIQFNERTMGQSVISKMSTIDDNNRISHGNGTARNRVLPEVPNNGAKSPRVLPMPPLADDEGRVNELRDETIQTDNKGKKSNSSSQNNLSGFKRAELYRVHSPENNNRASEIPRLELTRQEGSSKDTLVQETTYEQKEFRRALSVADTPKTTNKLSFFRAHSTKDGKKEKKSEPVTERIYDPYQSEDLNTGMKFTRAYSGMLAAHIVRIEKLQSKSSKEKFYCTIEIDDEFKASTSKKKMDLSTQNVNFDEQFDIELSHASEMTIYVFSIGPNKQHSLISSAVIFLERVLNKLTSRSIALQLENIGVIFISLDFTEAIKYLKRTPSSRKSGVFGFNIASTLDDEKNTIPIIVRKCVEEIEKRGINMVGLYRISGNARKKKILKADFDNDSSSVDVSEQNGIDCHVLCGILKDYLRELPEPLIPEEVSDRISKAKTANCSPDLSKRQTLFSQLLKLLPYGSRATLIYIMDHLIRVAENHENNKMDLTNLAVCFGPVLMCPPSTNAVLDFKKIIDSLEFLLKIWPKSHEQGVEIEITSM